MNRYRVLTVICILHFIPRGLGQNFDEDDEDDNNNRDEDEFKPHRDKEPDYHLDQDPGFNQKQIEREIKEGNMADLFGTLDEYHPHKYKELNRRRTRKQIRRSTLSNTDEDSKLIPVRAAPEVVLEIVKKSKEANTNVSRSHSTKENLQSYILRSGDYFNGVWKEEINPDLHLRTNNSPKQKMKSIKAKIMPGSKLYNLVQILTKISPRLLYVINKKKTK